MLAAGRQGPERWSSPRIVQSYQECESPGLTERTDSGSPSWEGALVSEMGLTESVPREASVTNGRYQFPAVSPTFTFHHYCCWPGAHGGQG